MVEVILLAPITHDKKDKAKGELVKMSKEQADRLVKLELAKLTGNNELVDDEGSDEPEGDKPEAPRNPNDMSKDELLNELAVLGVAVTGKEDVKKLSAMLMATKREDEAF